MEVEEIERLRLNKSIEANNLMNSMRYLWESKLMKFNNKAREAARKTSEKERELDLYFIRDSLDREVARMNAETESIRNKYRELENSHQILHSELATSHIKG